MAEADVIVAGAGLWGCTLARYRAEAAKILNLTLGGRLGAYCYYDMDDAIGAALSIAI